MSEVRNGGGLEPEPLSARSLILSLLLYRALAFLTARYNAALGRAMPRRQAPWMKPMSVSHAP